MAKQRKQARAAEAARVVSTPPKGAMRVSVRVRRSGRTMKMSVGEARALVALRVVEYIDTTPAVMPALTYMRRDVVAMRAGYGSVVFPIVNKDDGEAE